MLSIKLAEASLNCIINVDLDKRRLSYKHMSVSKVDETVHGLGGIKFVHQKLVLLTYSFQCLYR